MPLKQDQDASSSAIAMVVAGAIFVAMVGAILTTSLLAGRDRSGPDDAVRDVEAGSLADLLISSPGIGWGSGADDVIRLGLGAENGSGLEPDSIMALKGAMTDSYDNDRVDYEDAQRSLGLDPAGAQDFHIRIYPVGMEQVYDASLSSIRVGYVADFTSLSSVTLAIGTPPANYVAQANVQMNLTMGASTVLERQAIRQLGLDFTDRVFVSSTPSVVLDQVNPLPDLNVLTLLGLANLEGDVYPDIKTYLDTVLVARLGEYDLLVVGSGVNHNSLTSNAVKDGIRDWVLDGGMLVVLGTEDQGYQWLQPLFHAGVATVNGAAVAPDVSHPLLKEPNQLDWTNYDSHERGWDIKDTGTGAHYDDFSHVIVQDGEDVLAISKDGAFGDGRIMLTTYLPREIAADIGLEEAMGFIENIVLYADHTNLYLEYGPAAPSQTPVSTAVRQSWLWDETLGQVPVRIEIQTWSGG